MIDTAFHMHLREAPYTLGQVTPKQLVDILHKNDIEVCYITDKNSVDNIRRISDYASKKDVSLPYSSEIMTKEHAEIIAIFRDFEEPDKEMDEIIRNGEDYSYLEIIDNVKDRGGNIVLPHPYLNYTGIMDAVGEKGVEYVCRKGGVDALEWNLEMNNIFTWKDNMKSLNFANKVDLPIIYGNDTPFGDPGLIMSVESDDLTEVTEKILKREYKLKIKKRGSIKRELQALCNRLTVNLLDHPEELMKYI